MAEQHADQVFVEYIVKAIVDNPDGVKVDRSVDEMGVLLTLSVHPDDMGNLIGRSGNTAKAIRTLLRIVGAKNNARVNLKILEPEGSDRKKREPVSREPKKTTNVEDAIDDLKI
jgi:uncharacterized protein